MKKNSYKVMALDLDGTVSQHKSKLSAENRMLLKQLMKQYQVVFVGAGTCRRIYQQLDELPVDIIGNYGMQFSKVVNKKFTLLWNERKEPDRERVMNIIFELRKQLLLPDKVSGDIVEFHESGVITFPLLGTKASLEDKLQYDPKRQKRRKFLPEIKKRFPNDTVVIGGSSSFDIAPFPYTKLYGLDTYLKQHDLSHKDVIYMGDDYGTGGNDEDIYHSDIRFVCVDDYLDFPKAIKEFLV